MIERPVHRAPTKNGIRTDKAIYAPYPFAGNASNTTARYEAIAERTGCDVYPAVASGCGRVIIDRATRKSLRPNKFHELTDAAASLYSQVLSSYAVRLGMGDSGRGMWVASMQDSNFKPFSHVLIRDGINLYPWPLGREPVLQGAVRLALHGGDTNEIPDLTYADSEPVSRSDHIYTAACAISEAVANARVVCSTEGMGALAHMVGASTTPTHFVTLGHGISGPVEQIDEYTALLKRVRSYNDPSLTSFRHTHEPDWAHGNLLAVNGAAAHIETTVGLQAA